jgi:hypothetical protein
MVSHGLKGLLGAVAAGSLMLSSTAAMASAPAPVQQIDPWAALSVLTGGAPAAAMCGAAAAAAAAQAPTGCVLPVLDAAPPPPQTVEVVPPPAVLGGGGISPVFLALGAILTGLAIFALVSNGGQNTVGATVPISPT